MQSGRDPLICLNQAMKLGSVKMFEHRRETVDPLFTVFTEVKDVRFIKMIPENNQ